MTAEREHDEQEVYQITVKGVLDETWSDWFSGMAVTFGDGVTTLTGPVADQAALRGILVKIWDLNLTLISASQIEIDFKDGSLSPEEEHK